MQRNEVSPFQEIIKLNFLNTDIRGPFRREERVKRNHFHAQAQSPVCGDRADIPAADNAKGFRRELYTHELGFFPLAFMRRSIGFRNLPRKSRHHGNGMFCRCDGITKRRVHDDHTGSCCGRKIDIVDTNTSAPYHFQVFCGFKYRRRQFGGRANSHPVIVANDFDQFIPVETGNHIHLNATIFKDLRSSGAHLVGNKNLRHQIVS